MPISSKSTYIFLTVKCDSLPPGEGGGDSNIKKGGVLVVLLRGVNFRFWSCLGVEEKSPIFLAFKVSLRVAREEMQQFFKLVLFT